MAGQALPLAAATTPFHAAITFFEVVVVVAWLVSLAVPLGLGLRPRRPPTLWDLLSPFASGGWNGWRFKLLLPIEVGFTLMVIVGLDDRVPIPLKLPPWALIGSVTILVLVAGFRREQRWPRDPSAPVELPEHERGYARTIADLEDAIAPGPGATGPGATGQRRARHRQRRRR